MLWLAITTVLVSIWLFRENLPYMKLSMVVGLALCTMLFLGDVDARVAQYNVRAYQSGKLQTVDVEYLRSLSDGAIPYLEELTRDADEKVARDAINTLRYYYKSNDTDWRRWNLASARAAEILEQYQGKTNERAEEDIL